MQLPPQQRRLVDETNSNSDKKKLYGREEELKVLRGTFQRAASVAEGGEGSPQQQRILVGGPSGSGKSALVNASFLNNRRITIVSGSSKFLSSESSSNGTTTTATAAAASGGTNNNRVPYRAMVQSLGEICEKLSALEEDTNGYGTAIENAFEAEELSLLMQLIPQLDGLVVIPNGDKKRETGTNSFVVEEEVAAKETVEQLKFCLRLLVETLATSCSQQEDQPTIVLFWDDMQWIDDLTLDLLKSTLSNSDLNDSFVFVGTYREDEVLLDDENTDHIVGKWINQQLQQTSEKSEPKEEEKEGSTKKEEEEAQEQQLAPVHWHLTHIKLRDLTVDQLEDMLLDLLKIEASSPRTIELAQVIHNRTEGNPFHVLQLLQVMQDRHLFEYSPLTLQWTWDIEAIRRRTSLCYKTALAIVALKLDLLSNAERECLKICCCLGYLFYARILSTVAAELLPPGADPIACLQTLVDYGLLLEISESQLKFSHDQMFSASQNLLCEVEEEETGDERKPLQKKTRMHLRIGQILMEAHGDAIRKGDTSFLFLCIDQLNRGRLALRRPSSSAGGNKILPLELKMARLNLLAGKRAAALSAFVPSAEYLEKGISLLRGSGGYNDNNPWKEHYHLSLQLHTALAEVSFSAGRKEQRELAVSQVIRFASNCDDAIAAYFVQIKSLAADTSKASELLETAGEALRVLGEPLPTKVTKNDLGKLMKKTRKKLEAMANDEILGLPQVSNIRKGQAIQIYSRCFVPLDRSLKTDEDKRPIVDYILWKAISLSLECGLAQYSGVAFSLLALKLSDPKDIDLAHRCAILAQKLTSSDDRSLRVIQVNIDFNLLFMRYWREPLSLLVDSAIKIHRTGLRLGDHWSGFAGVLLYGMFYYLSGLPIGPLAKDLKKFSELIIDYGFHVTALWLLPCYQATLNLLGQADNDIADLGSQAVTKALRKRCGWKEGGGDGEHSAWGFSMQIAFYCEEFEHANAMAEKLKQLKEDALPVAFTYQPRIFFFCLIAAHKARQTRKNGYKREARKHFEVVRGWVVDGRSINMAHKLRILEAEMLQLEQDEGLKSVASKILKRSSKVGVQGEAANAKMREAYDSAIAAATRAGFLQDAALAAQLASYALPQHRKDYFAQALQFYGTWGAVGVIEHLAQKRHMSWMDDSVPTNETRGYKSRERFDGSLVEEHNRLEFALENSTEDTGCSK